ncbi:cyanophycinase [Colwellia sp. MEBiC06753]
MTIKCANLVTKLLLFAAISPLSLANTLVSTTNANHHLTTELTTEKFSTLFLVGGGLKTCSSVAPLQCIEDKHVTTDTVKQSPIYQVTDANIKLLESNWPKERLANQRQRVIALLQKLVISTKGQSLTKAQLKQHWHSLTDSTIVNQLADNEYFLMLDALEVGQFNQRGHRLKEQVALKASTNPHTVEIFQRFTELANKIQQNKSLTHSFELPHILVVTASARDPYEAVDFYQQVFEQTNAKVTWLPIDAALNNLWQDIGHSPTACNELSNYQATILSTIKRKITYPDLYQHQFTMCQNPEEFIRLINSADGIFINGGDQSLTRQAFILNGGEDNAVLTAIKKQLTTGKLIVGGTSAGTAVMSGGFYLSHQTPMITNGTSETALVRGSKKDLLPSSGCHRANLCSPNVLNDDLTYHSKGGIGLFPWGVLDTHFSERGRQGRLAQLLLDTGSQFGFGIDEATALIVKSRPVSDYAGNNDNSPLTMEVLGEHGVFIIENPKKANEKQVVTHYLHQGDKAELIKNQLNIDLVGQPISNNSQLIKKAANNKKIFNDIFVSNHYKQAINTLCLSVDKKLNARSQWQNNQTNIELTKAENWQAAEILDRTSSSQQVNCSYANLVFSVQDAIDSDNF